MLKNQAGFTLVELMVTITVAAILLTIGVPSLVSLNEKMRTKSNIEKIHNIVMFARSQAISYGTTVIICPFASETSCGSTTDWSNGVRVYTTDSDGNDYELRAIDSFNNQDKIKGSAPILSFTAEGMVNVGGGSIVYCPGGQSTDSKSVSVSTSGLISYGNDSLPCT
ncbi:GspH/FimT family pseudopilin [Shewanella maritima]|uniref:GspH/FimT family pseudopilin n=1 Tax=Shewanella maritima TaxID=2520507 RepID=UPI0037354E15